MYSECPWLPRALLSWSNLLLWWTKDISMFFFLFFSFPCFIQNPEGKNITQKTNWGQVCLPSFCSPGSFYPIFPNSKFHFLCFQFTSPPLWILVFGVPLMLNLFQWSFPRDWQSEKTEARGGDVQWLARKRGPKLQPCGLQVLRGSQERRSFFVKL